jgi:hypothetical protein
MKSVAEERLGKKGGSGVRGDTIALPKGRWGGKRAPGVGAIASDGGLVLRPVTGQLSMPLPTVADPA